MIWLDCRCWTRWRVTLQREEGPGTPVVNAHLEGGQSIREAGLREYIRAIAGACGRVPAMDVVEQHVTNVKERAARVVVILEASRLEANLEGGRSWDRLGGCAAGGWWSSSIWRYRCCIALDLELPHLKH